MKTLWNAIAVVAIANLLALLALVGWLAMGDKLSSGRVDRIKQIFSETVTAEENRLATEAAEAEALLAISEGETIPVSAADQVREQNILSQMDMQTSERTRREAQDLRASFTRERESLRRDREDLERRIAGFEAMQEQLREVEGSQQFQKALSVLRGLRAPDAVRLLQESVNAAAGDPDSEQMITVIAYLDALPDRQRSKVMNEFVKQDPALAADLLERLRTKGLPPEDGDATNGIDQQPGAGTAAG
ncbi:MAG: hypothetical protein AAGB51_00390 [Planctomycetota bacterium]